MKKNLFFLFFTLFMSALQLKAAPGDFVTIWDLSIDGNTTSISFENQSAGPVNYSWETIPAGTSGSGTYFNTPAVISGIPSGAKIRLFIQPTNIRRFIINNNSDKNKLLEVEQWGSAAWSSFQAAFSGCSNLQVTATDIPNLSSCTSMGAMFANCTSLTTPANINTWNTSNVKGMGGVFRGASAFNLDISAWNTVRVDDMSSMFLDASSFNQDISTWNTDSVLYMSEMFRGASSFNQDISSWNTSNVVTFFWTFLNATSFNQDISSWNTANVTNMQAMFGGATSFNQDISSWDVGAITTMREMFGNATSFNQNLGAWEPGPNADMGNMFNLCGLDCINYSATLSGWSANPNTPTERNLGAAGMKYGAFAVAARDSLLLSVAQGGKGWQINGDQLLATEPTFDPIAPICIGDNLSPLPTTSNNGISGSWSPALNNAQTTTYIFTPNPGQCVDSTTLTIEVNPNAPSFDLSDTTLCEGFVFPALPETSINNITGTWSPALSSSITQTYTFTPNPAFCAVPFEFTINIQENDLDASITVNEAILRANQENVSYQWINCADNAIIPNATEQNYTATVTGEYAVIISNGLCTDTSACESVVISGILDEQLLDNVVLYPNPTKEVLFIQTQETIESVMIYNVLGALVQKDNQASIQVSDLEKGLYFMQVKTGNGIAKLRFIKE